MKIVNDDKSKTNKSIIIMIIINIHIMKTFVHRYRYDYELFDIKFRHSCYFITITTLIKDILTQWKIDLSVH